MGPLSALLFAALGTAAPTRAAADEAVASAPRHDDDGPRDPFAMLPVHAPVHERAAAPPPPPPPPDPPPRPIVVAPLRDPFVAPLPPGTREISADLKDPFSLPSSGRRMPLRPIRDIRDPFVPRPDGSQPGECASSGGVPVQRPKSMPAPVKRCPSRDAPLVNPFSAA